MFTSTMLAPPRNLLERGPRRPGVLVVLDQPATAFEPVTFVRTPII